MAELFSRKIQILKVGSRLFTTGGPSLLVELTRYIPEIFLDLKFHDIPNTVAGAVRAAAALPGVKMLTLHASGGLAMMRAGRVAADASKQNLMLLAVTVLTSMDSAELARVGVTSPPPEQVVRLANLAQEAGMDGVISSPLEVSSLRKECGSDFLIVVPGIRPAQPRSTEKGASADDQRRVAAPAAAILAGADYLVVGRPILNAADPVAAADAIIREMESTA
jgi:orotidine-5'-phosphate decarboxylase